VTAFAALVAAAALPLGYAPAWNPDGTRLAYTRGPDVWVADANGTHRARLVRNGADPAWAPGGRALAFVRGGSVWTVRADGAGARRVAPGAHPAWTPWGDVAYDRGGTVYFASAGSKEQPLASGEQPAWSAGGSLAVRLDGTIVLDGVPIAPGTAPAWTADNQLVYQRPDGAIVVGGRTGVTLQWRPRPAERELLPDFEQRAPTGLTIAGGPGHWRLGFTSLVDNVGQGPAIIVGVRPSGASRMVATQRVELSNGKQRVYRDVGHLRYTNSPPHFHWHLMRFDAFELRTLDGRTLVTDRKSGFCLADHYGLAPGNWNRRPAFFGNCEQGRPHATYVLQGTSLGYTDRYPAFFHGQNVDITHVLTGTYVLVHQVNKNMGLHELRYDNNMASVRVRLTWRLGVPSVRVLRSCQATATC